MPRIFPIMLMHNEIIDIKIIILNTITNDVVTEREGKRERERERERVNDG